VARGVLRGQFRLSAGAVDLRWQFRFVRGTVANPICVGSLIVRGTTVVNPICVGNFDRPWHHGRGGFQTRPYGRNLDLRRQFRSSVARPIRARNFDRPWHHGRGGFQTRPYGRNLDSRRQFDGPWHARSAPAISIVRGTTVGAGFKPAPTVATSICAGNSHGRNLRRQFRRGITGGRSRKWRRRSARPGTGCRSARSRCR
jgi:hypothetical protein